MKRFVPLLVAIGSTAWIAYQLWGNWADASTIVRVTSAAALIAAFAAAFIPRDRPPGHAAVAACVLFVLAGFAGSRVLGRWPFQWDAMPDARYAAFIATVAAATGVGLCRGAFWARWVAIALSVGSGLGGLLNAINLRHVRDESSWLASLGVIVGAVVLSALLRPEVTTHFSRHAMHALWSSRDRLIRLLYALGQPVAPSTAPSALCLAALLGGGAVLVVLRRAAGLVVLGLGGIALLVHTAASAEYVTAGNLPIVGYYAAFWLPAAILGVAAARLALVRARA
jgi:hypothetical protein